MMFTIQVNVCKKCQHTNTRTFDKVRPELHPVKVQSPWYRIGIDLIGLLTVSKSGKRYILTLSDYCTKWINYVQLVINRCYVLHNCYNYHYLLLLSLKILLIEVLCVLDRLLHCRFSAGHSTLK